MRVQTFIAIFCKCKVGVNVNAHKCMCYARHGATFVYLTFKMLSRLALYGTRSSNFICTFLCLYVVNIKSMCLSNPLDAR
jgi:hypothetical protein